MESIDTANDTVSGNNGDTPLVGVIMGSKSDWETMRWAHEMLDRFGVAHECKHRQRPPDAAACSPIMRAGRRRAGSRCSIVAGAGGAAHLPGMAAAFTILPVLGVPVESHALKGMDSLLSIAQMPGGVPVGTLAIGKAGAINAALLGGRDSVGVETAACARRCVAFRAEQTATVLGDVLPDTPPLTPLPPLPASRGERGSLIPNDASSKEGTHELQAPPLPPRSGERGQGGEGKIL